MAICACALIWVWNGAFLISTPPVSIIENVLPNAEVKIYQIASVECRAKRRYDENMEKGIPCTFEEIAEDVRRRDYIDSHRDFAPLKQAEDAICLDTSDMTIEEVVAEVIRIIQEKVKELENK